MTRNLGGQPIKHDSRNGGGERAPHTALLTLVGQGRLAQAQSLARTMTERHPEDGLAWKYLGALLWGQGHTERALVAMRTSASLLPHDVEAQKNLGTALVQLKRFDEAKPYLLAAVAADPGLAAPYYQLGMISLHEERFGAAEAHFRQGLSVRAGIASDDVAAHSALLMLMTQNPSVDAASLYAEHVQYGASFEAPLRAAWPQHTNPKNPDRPLRVGFVSGDFRDHAVATFIEPVWAQLQSAAGLLLHAYYNDPREDAVTARLRGHVRHWHAVAALSDTALAQQILEDGIDVLIDLSGHTARNRLRSFARKPAPVQVSWLGYPGTTGLTAMDYYLADRLWLAPGQFDAQFTEKLVYLPDRWAFQPDAAAPPVNDLPAPNAGPLTFGSFNRLGKINPATVRLWSALLRALPDSRMLLGGMPGAGEPQDLLAQFAAHGIERARLEVHGRCSIAAYLALHHRVDLCLDTHPYAGGTTTMHALWMGVPTLTLAGATSFARAGAGILGHAGLPEFIAIDDADFLAKGLYWATHLHDLAALRAGLRTRLQQSPSGSPTLIAQHFERALRHMWQRWCAGLPAQAFDSA